MVSRTALVAAACVGVALASTEARALPLLPGGTLFPVPGEPDPVGGILLASLTAPITAPSMTGTLTSQVILNDASNPFGPNFITFTYLIVNDATSSDNVGRFTVSSFTGFQTDVSYQVPAAGLPPTLADRDAAGSVVGFDYISGIGPGPLAPGMTGALLVIQTDSTGFSPTTAAVIDATVDTVPSFAPAPGAGVPEPAALSVVALGGAALLLRRRRA